MLCVGKVHMTGLILREFASHNTLRLGDRYTLIDFHKCGARLLLGRGSEVREAYTVAFRNVLHEHSQPLS